MKHLSVSRPVEPSAWSTFSRNASMTDLTFGSDNSRPVMFVLPAAEYASATATTWQLAERAQSVAWPLTIPQFATSLLPGAISAQFLPATDTRSEKVSALGSLLKNFPRTSAACGLTTAITIDDAYIVCSAAFHFAERRPRMEASGETVAQLSLPLSHWLMISPEPRSVPELSRGKVTVTFSLPWTFWKPATIAGSAIKAFLSDAQHMLIVTGFSVAIRAEFLAAVHQELIVFFSVSSQVS